MKLTKKGFTLVELLVVIGILGILMGALFPAITSAMIKANMSACSMRGRNLFVAITSANTEREAAGLGSVWPRTQAAEAGAAGGDKDISENGYSSAYMYFNDLFDVKDMNKPEEWSPFVTGVDLTCLSGAGVAPVAAGSELVANNVGWCVGANVQDELEDIVPILVSRNINCGELLKEYASGRDKVGLGKAGGSQYNTPFGNKGYVIIRKGGGVISMTAKYSTTDVIYNKQVFKMPEASEEYQAFTYLTPDSTQSPK
ncbi:MAG: type II secretion system protein [Kiritimatiellae bacterium]|nr:type II secretion system protein [Kiritimatiellia bacterium]